jgi:hypothetical protein
MDGDLSLEAGSTLALMRHLLTTKAVAADLSVSLNDHRPMVDFKLCAAKAGQKVA